MEKTFLLTHHFWEVVDSLLDYAKNIDGTYTAEDFTTDNEGVMEMIEEELDNRLCYVWVDDGGYLYPKQDNLRPTAEEICKAIHEQF
jgi:hypothetical protein